MANDININESAILETLNAKIDYDGGNYPSSGLEAQVNKSRVAKSGDTITGTLNVKEGFSAKCIEFSNANNNNGGYIDFHFNGNKTVDFTSRIIEDASEHIAISANNGFNFPKCATKATTTSSARNDLVAVITQNYVNGTSWYRVWSDGWKEQGGHSVHAKDEFYTITFLKAFSNSNYNIQITMANTDAVYNNTIAAYRCAASYKTATNFQVRGIATASVSNIDWYACGY